MHMTMKHGRASVRNGGNPKQVGRQMRQVRSRQRVEISKLVRRQAAAVRIVVEPLGGQRGRLGLRLVLCSAKVLQQLGVAIHDDLADLT